MGASVNSASSLIPAPDGETHSMQGAVHRRGCELTLAAAAPLRKTTVDVVAQLNIRLPRPRTNALDPRRHLGPDLAAEKMPVELAKSRSSMPSSPAYRCGSLRCSAEALIDCNLQKLLLGARWLQCGRAQPSAIGDQRSPRTGNPVVRELQLAFAKPAARTLQRPRSRRFAIRISGWRLARPFFLQAQGCSGDG